jgi:hypothetical protein
MRHDRGHCVREVSADKKDIEDRRTRPGASVVYWSQRLDNPLAARGSDLRDEEPGDGRRVKFAPAVDFGMPFNRGQ